VSTPFAPRTIFPPVCVFVVVVAAAVALVTGRPADWRGRSGTTRSASGFVAASAANFAQRIPVVANLGGLPLAFEANQGQTDPRVKYMARGIGYRLFLTTTDAVFALRGSSKEEMDRAAAISMHLVGANAQAQIVAGGELPGRTNYFLGSDPRKWQRGVKQYNEVSYRDVYPGVALAFRGQERAGRQMEFDFVVAPGADAAAIALRFSGARETSIDDSGMLTLGTWAGTVTLHPPVAYQKENGGRRFVDVHFVLKAANEVSFALGAYDRGRELLIDPSVGFATYLGGSGQDDGNAIAVDGADNAYITGDTASTDFPTVTGDYRTSNGGGLDVFVTKISPDGQTLLYSTYVGGSGGDIGSAIAVDALGDAFVAGQTASSADFPHTTGAFQTIFGGGGTDAFVFELNPSGSGLTYSTYLGGTGDDAAAGIAVDNSGNTYIVGSTTSTNFPTHNAKQSSIVGQSNGFVTKLNPSGNALVYSTYLGGGTGDFASAVALDSIDQAYVTGATQNSSFPTTQGAFQTSCGTAANCNGGLDDAFVTVYSQDGSNFVYSTFLGGEEADQGFGIAVDSAGDAYVTGATLSTLFPVKSAIQKTYGGNQDAFVTAFNAEGSGLLYSTYLGGSLNETGTGIAVDGSNNVYVTGQTGSSNFPTVNPTQAKLGGDNDAYVAEINSTGSTLVFSTYLGGSLDENSSIATGTLGAIGGIAVDHEGASFYVTGNTSSTNFPTQSPKYASNAGMADAFVAKYVQPNFTVSASPLNPAAVDPGVPATSTVTIGPLNGFNNSVALTCEVTPTTGTPPTCSLSPSSAAPGTPSTLTVTTTTATTPDSYTITVTGTANGFVHTTSVMLTVNQPDFTVAASPLSPAAVTPGNSATSTVTLGSVNGFNAAVALTCSITPVGLNPPTCGYSATSVTPPGTSILTVRTTANTSGGNYMITVRGTSNGVANTVSVNLTVNAPDFVVAATALSPPAVMPGNSSTSTVSVTALNGFNSAVTLTCAVTPVKTNGPTCAVSPESVNPGTPSTLTVTTVASTPGPRYTVTVNGSSGALAHSTTVNLTVNAPDFTISGTALAVVAQGGSTTSTITIAEIYGYKGTIDFTCTVANATGGSPLPTCMIPNPVTGGAGTSTLTVITSGSALALYREAGSGIFYAMWLPIVALSVIGVRFSTAESRRKKMLGMLLVGVVMTAIFFLPACGGGSGKNCSGCTPPGTYDVTVMGTDSANALTHPVTLPLTVTQLR